MTRTQARSAYEIFCSENRDLLEGIGMSSEETKATLLTNWRRASCFEKEKFKLLEKEERQKYCEEVKGCEVSESCDGNGNGNGERTEKRKREYANSDAELEYLCFESEDSLSDDEEFDIKTARKIDNAHKEYLKLEKVELPRKKENQRKKENERKTKKLKKESNGKKEEKERKEKKMKEKREKREMKEKKKKLKEKEKESKEMKDKKERKERKEKKHEEKKAQKEEKSKSKQKELKLFQSKAPSSNSSEKAPNSFKPLSGLSKPTLLIKKYKPLVSSTPLHGKSY